MPATSACKSALPTTVEVADTALWQPGTWTAGITVGAVVVEDEIGAVEQLLSAGVAGSDTP